MWEGPRRRILAIAALLDGSAARITVGSYNDGMTEATNPTPSGAAPHSEPRKSCHVSFT